MRQQVFILHVRGVSLIELMVAVALGLLLVAGIIQLFTGSRVTYMSTEAMARVQEDGRFAMEFIRSPLREAGTHGFCSGRISIANHLNSNEGTLWDERMFVLGWDYSGSGPGQNIDIDTLTPASNGNNWSAAPFQGYAMSFPGELVGRAVPGSDIVFIRRIELIPGLAKLIAANQNDISVIATVGPTGVREGEVVMVTDCSGADIVQKTNNSSSSNINAAPGATYNPGNQNFCSGGSPTCWETLRDRNMQIMRARAELYYVGFNADRGEPGLYLYRLGINETEELVQGVENMQILYGYSRPANEGGDGKSVDWWLPANQVPDWTLVIAIKLAMSVRSPDPAGPERVERTFELACNQTGVCSQVTFKVDESRLRQPFSTTVSLRNRGLVE